MSYLEKEELEASALNKFTEMLSWQGPDELDAYIQSLRDDGMHRVADECQVEFDQFVIDKNETLDTFYTALYGN